MLTAGDLIRTFTERLEKAGVYAPLSDAQAFVAFAMDLPFEKGFPLPWGTPVDEAVAQKAAALVQRREDREPFARIVGFTTFWGLKIPMADKIFRPDPLAEAMVEQALLLFEERKNEPLRILDLGTGSGCFLFALLHEWPKATGVGVDIDEASVAVAQKNAVGLGLHSRATFVQSNWAEKIDEKFDFIISNPPAVSRENWPRLAPEMSRYETVQSLSGGADGLDFFRAIAPDLGRLMKPEGWALFRAYTWTCEASILRKAGFAKVDVKENYRGNPCCAVVGAEKKKPSLWG